MDIRTKLALAFVSVALASMIVPGLFAYRTAAGMLRDASARQLDALAESKTRDLANVIEGWEDRVRLIGSRTQLRISLAAHADGDGLDLERMQRILTDAEQASADVLRIAIFDRRGRLLVSAGSAEPKPQPAARDTDLDKGFSRIYHGADDTPFVVIARQLLLDDRTIGSMEVVLDAREISDVAGDFTGLGATGEVLVLSRDVNGDPRLLHDGRHAKVPRPESLKAEYVKAALAGTDKVFDKGVADYRGVKVWAATDFVPRLQWGVVVKVDVEEELAPVAELRADMIDLGLALGAFAIAGGTLMGFALGRPIRDLADLVVRLRHGERGLRAEVRGDDEVAVLSGALNEWMDEMDGHHHPGTRR